VPVLSTLFATLILVSPAPAALPPLVPGQPRAELEGASSAPATPSPVALQPRAGAGGSPSRTSLAAGGVLAQVWPPVAERPLSPSPSADEQAEIERALSADAQTQKDGPASASPAPATGAASAAASNLNPDLAVITDLALAAFSNEAPLQTGGHDPRKNGFNLQQLELSIRKAVDPYFRFDGNIVFSQFGVEIEEAYATTLALPASLQLRAGQFLTRVGRLNATHPHAWDFVDQPFVIGRLFGAEGNRGLGLELSYLTPLPWYVELVGSLTDAAGEATARSFHGAQDLGVFSPLDLQATLAAKQFFPLSDDLSLAWGLTAALGPNATGHRNRTDIYGSDLYLKYRPITTGSHTVIALQAEWFYRRRQVPRGCDARPGRLRLPPLAVRPALGSGGPLRARRPQPERGRPARGRPGSGLAGGPAAGERRLHFLAHRVLAAAPAGLGRSPGLVGPDHLGGLPGRRVRGGRPRRAHVLREERNMDTIRDARIVLGAIGLMAIGLVVFAGPTACTFEPGRSFGSMRPSLTGRYELRGDRDAGGGWQKLSNDYEVRVDRARLTLEPIQLLAAAAGATVRFDPARPPPGYGLCHNGHCHAADGRLVPYAEIEAELAGGAGGGGLAIALTLPVEGALDLLASDRRALDCRPGCNVDRTRIRRAVAPLSGLLLEGTVRDGRQPPRLTERPFHLQLGGGGTDGGAPAQPIPLEVALDIPIDQRHPPAVTLGLAVALGADLLDGIDFAALPAPAGTVDLAAAEARLRTNLSEGSFLEASVERTN
jgi:hypothetical protein